MIFRRALRPSSPRTREPPRTAEGQVVFAIGDIHGRGDLLRLLLEQILRDPASAEGKAAVVFVGDYIDRGPDSRGVLDQLLALRQRGLGESVFLRGNHDQTLLDFLAEPATGPMWLSIGGGDTLASYGVAPPRPSAGPSEWAEASRALADALPASHHAFLTDLELTWRSGDYLFAHAGVRPDRPLEAQSAKDLLWIRRAFLNDTRPLPWTVVHGHTPSEAVHCDFRRIGIDTGAYATDVLTAVRLEGAEKVLLQTKRVEPQTFTVVWRELPQAA
jgi:serine/threonine protein phosphatase 1